MPNRRLIHFVVQVLVFIFVCSTAGFIGLISTGALGGTAMGVAPEFTFSLVEPIICPENTELEYSSIRRSYHQPGESEPHVECVADDGTRMDALMAGVLSVMALSFIGTFLSVFVLMGVPLAIGAFVIVRLILKRNKISF